MPKSRAFVVTTILPDDAVITEEPNLQTPGNVTFRSQSTKELFWLDKKIWNCYQNHEASDYYCCEICHPYWADPKPLGPREPIWDFSNKKEDN